MLIREVAGGWVTGLLRTHAHAVKLSLLGRHVAIIAVEGTHGSLSTAVESRGWVCDGYTSLLGRRQFLDEAVGRTYA